MTRILMSMDNSPSISEKSFRFKVFKVSKSDNSAIDRLDYQRKSSSAVDLSKGRSSAASISDSEVISFQYKWQLRISKRLVGSSEPNSVIMNVSPVFCTAVNGVQFTWILRLCEENLLDFGGCADDDDWNNSTNSFSRTMTANSFRAEREKRVNVSLYYRDGPSRDVTVQNASITIQDMEGKKIFSENMGPREYTKGGGWSPLNAQNSEQSISSKFSRYIHENVGKQMVVVTRLSLSNKLFQPLTYLPNVEAPNKALETLCESVLEELRSSHIDVPDVEFFDCQNERYALHRHVFLFACREIAERWCRQHKLNDEMVLAENEGTWQTGQQNPKLNERIQNIFAHMYFNRVIAPEAVCFEDFLEALEASEHVQFPALKRECERFICHEVMMESADLSFVKKMSLLAERFDLPVLKMVSFGVIVDKLLRISSSGETDPHEPIEKSSRPKALNKERRAESFDEMREELLQLAEQITTNVGEINNESTRTSHQNLKTRSRSLCISSDCEEEDSESDDTGEMLVGSVIEQLEELARHIRKVSLPPGVTPAPMVAGSIHSNDSQDGFPEELELLHLRRVSLKTSRECLQSSESVNGGGFSGRQRQTSGSLTSGNSGFLAQIFGRTSSNSDSSDNTSDLDNTSKKGSPTTVAKNSPLPSPTNKRKSVLFNLPLEVAAQESKQRELENGPKNSSKEENHTANFKNSSLLSTSTKNILPSTENSCSKSADRKFSPVNEENLLDAF